MAAKRDKCLPFVCVHVVVVMSLRVHSLTKGYTLDQNRKVKIMKKLELTS